MPPHDTYVELFVGSGAILKRKPLSCRSIVFDLDKAVLDALPAWPSLTKVHGSALDFLAQADTPNPNHGRTLYYADPPYLLSTRTSRCRYKHEFTDADHTALLAALQDKGRKGASVILSGYPNAIYDAELAGWNTKEFQAMTRGGVRTEKVWFNFEPQAVHWASYAGENYTDRQRIKRKAARWAAKFRDLPPAERQAVLSALLEAHPSQS